MLASAAEESKRLAVYQLTWKTEPGLRGLACREFRAVPTQTPDRDGGVAVEFASNAERDALLRQLEEHFAAQRFSNAASAFETVKAYVLDWAARRQ